MKNKSGFSPLMASALGALMIGTLAVVTPARAQQQQQPTESVYGTLMANPEFYTTMEMVYMAGAANQLATAGSLTVFAPTNEAWDRSGDKGLLGAMSSSNEAVARPQTAEITGLLQGFFVRGEPTLGQRQDMRMESAAGRPIEFDPATMTVTWVDQGGATHSAKVTGQPIMATNGVIYPVDAVVGG